jgi:hypothetical protein
LGFSLSVSGDDGTELVERNEKKHLKLIRYSWFWCTKSAGSLSLYYVFSFNISVFGLFRLLLLLLLAVADFLHHNGKDQKMKPYKR